MTKKIVIVGAGYAGTFLGKLLHKKIKKGLDATVTLIDRNPYHTLMTELHEVAGHRTEKDSVLVFLDKIFAQKKVDFVCDDVTKIDFEKQVLQGKEVEYEYDYLVLATGSSPTFFGIEGAKENSLTLWSYEDALKVREHIEDLFRKASRENNEEKRRKILTMAVAGGGFTGIELAGELAEAKKALGKKYGVNPDEASVEVIEGMDDILSMLSDDLTLKANKRLAKMDIKVRTNCFINKVEADKIHLKNGEIIETSTLIWTAGIKSSDYSDSLEINKGHRGKIEANEFLQSTQYENIFVIGDNAAYSDDDGPMPQIVEAAIGTAETAANNLTNLINNDELEKHHQKYNGFMVSIGSKYSVSDTAGLKLTGFLSILLKHIINMKYLIEIGGLSTLWTYWLHEFFHIKDDKSMFGGHFSRRTPNFWMVPLRLFLGVMWLIEGVTKVKDGWLNPDNIYIITVSGASEAVDDAAYATVVPIFKEVPGFMQWFMDTVIAKAPFMFQSVVVVSEILIGLALIGGVLTFLVSVYSILLTFNFVLSGMAGIEVLWYTFASIAIIGGGGRVFSLDYYLMPWLKTWWKKRKFAQKSYLFFD